MLKKTFKSLLFQIQTKHSIKRPRNSIISCILNFHAYFDVISHMIGKDYIEGEMGSLIFYEEISNEVIVCGVSEFFFFLLLFLNTTDTYRTLFKCIIISNFLIIYINYIIVYIQLIPIIGKLYF